MCCESLESLIQLWLVFVRCKFLTNIFFELNCSENEVDGNLGSVGIKVHLRHLLQCLKRFPIPCISRRNQ